MTNNKFSIETEDFKQRLHDLKEMKYKNAPAFEYDTDYDDVNDTDDIEESDLID